MNSSFKQPRLHDGDLIVGGNFTQLLPGTPICVGQKITFRGCNLVNVLIDAAWTVEGCNNAQISFCAHLHPWLVERGLPECAERCIHFVETVEVEIDGQKIVEQHMYQDKVL